jgi:hypothetical protein
MINAIAELYDELLDEQGLIEIGIYKFNPSEVLKKCDPVVYDQGLLDFEDYIRENAELNND